MVKTTVETLNAAIVARAEARAKHQADLEALERGRQRFAEIRAAVKEFTDADAEAIERHARRAEAQTREGKSGPIPMLVPTEKHLTGEINARRTEAAAALMVANLEAAERDSRKALTEKEAAVNKAARAELFAEIRARQELFMREIAPQFIEQQNFLRGAYLAFPEALGDRDWIAINTPKGYFTAEDLNISLPMATWSVLDPNGIPDGRPVRSHVNGIADAWQRRLAKLQQEGIPGALAAAQDAA